MSQVGEEERFNANIKVAIDLVHELISLCYDNGIRQISPALIVLAGKYVLGIDKKELIEIFIENTYEECWEKIRNKNESFFIEHSDKILVNYR